MATLIETSCLAWVGAAGSTPEPQLSSRVIFSSHLDSSPATVSMSERTSFSNPDADGIYVNINPRIGTIVWGFPLQNKECEKISGKSLLGPPPRSSCNSNSISSSNSNSNLRHQKPLQSCFPLICTPFLILLLARWLLWGSHGKGSLAKNEKFNLQVSKHRRKPNSLEGLTFRKSVVQDHLKTVKCNGNSIGNSNRNSNSSVYYQDRLQNKFL